MKDRSFIDVDDGGLGIAAADPDVASNLIVITTGPQMTKSAQSLAKSAKATGKSSLVTFTPGSSSDGGREVVCKISTCWPMRPPMRSCAFSRRELRRPMPTPDPSGPTISPKATPLMNKATAGLTSTQ